MSPRQRGRAVTFHFPTRKKTHAASHPAQIFTGPARDHGPLSRTRRGNAVRRALARLFVTRSARPGPAAIDLSWPLGGAVFLSYLLHSRLHHWGRARPGRRRAGE